MIHFYRNLYYSPNIKNKAIVRWRLAHNAGSLAVYVIMLCEGAEKPDYPAGANLLEICHCAFLHQPWYKKHGPYVVGIAEGRTQAIQMTADLVQAAIDQYGTPDLRRYLFGDQEPKRWFSWWRRKNG